MKRRGSAIHQLIFGVLLGLGSGPSLCGAGGEEQFSKNCAPCHGKDGKAQTSIARKLGVKDLTQSKLTDAEIERQIVDGRRDDYGKEQERQRRSETEPKVGAQRLPWV